MAGNAELVRRYIEAVSAGDLDTVESLITDDVAIHVPGRSAMSGERRGKEGVLAMFAAMRDRSGGTMPVQVHDLLESDEHVVALLQRTIAGVDARAAIVYHLRDGLISEIWPHEADQYALDEAMGG